MKRKIVLELDEQDYNAIQSAITERQKFRFNGECVLPGSDESNLAGELVAEICRGWLEFLGKWKQR